MPSTPHYIPGESTKKKCSKCHEWKPLAEYHANGHFDNGIKRYKSRCKSCTVPQHKTPYPSSPCSNCADLEECKLVLNLLVLVEDHYEPAPLPCQDENFSMKRAAAWTEVVT